MVVVGLINAQRLFNRMVAKPRGHKVIKFAYQASDYVKINLSNSKGVGLEGAIFEKNKTQ